MDLIKEESACYVVAGVGCGHDRITRHLTPGPDILRPGIDVEVPCDLDKPNRCGCWRGSVGGESYFAIFPAPCAFEFLKVYFHFSKRKFLGPIRANVALNPTSYWL